MSEPRKDYNDVSITELRMLSLLTLCNNNICIISFGMNTEQLLA